jgi:Initiator Replication protein
MTTGGIVRPMFKTPTKELAHKRQGKVRQSNALIRSKQPLDLMQKRLFYLVLETIRTSDAQFDFIEIPDHILRDLLQGTYGSFREDLRVAAEGLVGTTFSLMKPSGGWAVTPIFDRIEYVRVGETTEQGFKNSFDYDVLRARLHTSLEPHLLRLEKNYNSQDLVYVLTIPRVRAHRLYEILLHESFKGTKPEVILEIEALQAFLGLEKDYERWQDLKRTLTRNQEIVHDFTDMRFTFDGQRQGKKVAAVKFQVSFVKGGEVQGTLEGPQEPQKQVEKVQLANELSHLGYALDPYSAIEDHGVEKIRYAIKKARAAQKANKGTKSEIHNPGGLLKHLLEVTLTVPSEDLKTSKEDIQKLADQVREDFENARAQAIAERLAKLSGKERDKLLKQVADKFSPMAKKIIKENLGDHGIYEKIRNTTLMVHHFVSLPEQLQSEKAFFNSLTKSYDSTTADRIRGLLE